MNQADAQVETAQPAVSHTVTDTRLRGRWLLFARIAWVVLVVFILACTGYLGHPFKK